MADRRIGWRLAVGSGCWWRLAPCDVLAQGPTIEETGTFQTATGNTTPGFNAFAPGADAGVERWAIRHAAGPRRDVLWSARAVGAAGSDVDHDAGRSVPRAAAKLRASSPRSRCPRREPPFYGTLEIPKEEEGDEGPPDGLTLDQAIDRLVHQNLDLRAKQLEIPQARADVLTASLRGNPIFFADSQLVPYGSDSVRQPGWPDPIRRQHLASDRLCPQATARMALASRALEVMEAQYQNEVRLAIQNLYIAYVDVLAARETVSYVQASVKGLEKSLHNSNAQAARQSRAVPTSIRPSRIVRSRSSGCSTPRKPPPEEANSGGTVEFAPRPGRATRAARHDRDLAPAAAGRR